MTNPRVDKPVPPGECCRRAGQDAIEEARPLSDAPLGAEGSIAYLSTSDHREIQKLMAIGILPGVHIRLIRRFPSYVFQVGYSQFTVDRELAAKIVVHWQHK
ncbi:MAG: FeoA family protein [Phycisphaerae bacterium]